MKTIYILRNTQTLNDDIIKAVFPGFVEMDVLDEHEQYYEPFLARINTAEAEAQEAVLIAKQVEKLWNACNAYQASKIATLGIMKLNAKETPNTKALAILQWVEDLWDEYYLRRECVTTTRIGMDLHRAYDCETKEIENIFNFDNMGDIPFSYKEAMEEA